MATKVDLKMGKEHLPGSEVYDRCAELTLKLGDAIPDGTSTSDVFAALGLLVVTGFKHAFGPEEDGMAAFDEWVAYHREKLREERLS